MYDVTPAKGEHPRILFSRADLPAIREKFNRPECRPLWDRVLRYTELMLSEDPPFICRRYMRPAHLALAYLVEGREDFGRKAVEMAMASCDNVPWVRPEAGQPREGVSLATGGAVSQLCYVYDWVHDLLTEAQKQRIREAIREHGFEANRYDFERGHPATHWHNCNGIGVINGPLLMAAVLLADEMDTQADYQRALHQVQHSIESWCVDGGYQEGPGYWNYYTRHLMLGVEAVRRFRGLDLYQLPFMRSTGDYMLHHILPDITHCADVADSSELTRLWPGVACLAWRHRQPRWQWLAQQMLTHPWDEDDGEAVEYAPFFLLWYDPTVPAQPPGPEHATRLFQGLQTVSWRSDWTRQSRQVLWLNGPANSHHNHLHLNSFTFAVGPHRFIRECGKYDYADYNDYRRGTPGHNTLLVDDQGQVLTLDDSYWCKRLRAGEWGSVYGLVHCHREECGSPIATAVAHNAYPGRLHTYERTLAFINRRYLFLHDHVAIAKDPPTKLSWLFHGDTKIDLTDDGALFHSGEARMRFIYRSETPVTLSVHHDHAVHHGDTLPCLVLEATCTTPHADLFAMLVPEAHEGELHLLPHADGMAFEAEGEQWVYERRTRSIRRAGDTPLPRRMV